MSQKSLQVPVQYVVESGTQTYARPYELKAPIQNSIQIWLDVEKLPQVNHWKLNLGCQVTGTSEETLAMESNAEVEAIVVVTGMEEAEAIYTLRNVAAPAVLGSLRTQLAFITQGTGMGTVTLPPFSSDQVAAFPSNPLKAAEYTA